MDQTLKEYCKANNLRYSMRKRGTRYYVTLAAKNPDNWRGSNNFFTLSTIVRQWYPNAVMTSGSVTDATFFVGDVVEILKGQ